MRRRPQNQRPAAPDQSRTVERLFRDHHANVRSFIARRVRPAEVDDVVAEAFATVWRRRRDLPRNPDLHRAWLLRIAHYSVLNQRRSRRRRLALVDKVVDDSRSRLERGSGDPYAAIPVEAAHDIDAVLRALSRRDQLVLTLVAWDDLSVGELAVILGCSENATTTRLSRARARFRTEVDRRASSAP